MGRPPKMPEGSSRDEALRADENGFMTSGRRTLRFTVPGPPAGQARPRIGTQGGRLLAFDPPSNIENRENIRAALFSAMKKQCFSTLPASMPVEVRVLSRRPIPPSRPLWYRRAARIGAVVPTTKPDGDNVVKALLDAMNGVAFADDRQVFRLSYEAAFEEGIPGTDVTVVGYYQDSGAVKERMKELAAAEKEPGK